MNNNALVISIIVPVYNTEKYLDQCIQSVLAQTYTNWELLLIDDGSTDSSGAICDKYAAEDKRIKVVHKPNTGVSDSKNIALDMARGEYVMFLDSDDYWCLKDCLEQLYIASQEFGADIVRGDYKSVDECGNLLFERVANVDKVNARKKVLPSSRFLTDVISCEFFLCLYLIKRSVIRGLRFNIERVFLEDAELLIKMLERPRKCVYLPFVFYSYRKHANAVTVKPNPLKLKNAFDFSRFCYQMARPINQDNEFYAWCARTGVENYMFDIKTISYEGTWDKLTRLTAQHSLKNLLKETRIMICKYKLWHVGYICILPLKIQMLLYKTRKAFRQILKWL